MARIKKGVSCLKIAKILGVCFLVFIGLCIVEHSSTLAGIEEKPSAMIGWVATKCMNLFEGIGKAVAWGSYFCYIGAWDLAVFFKNNLFTLVKEICKHLGRLLWRIWDFVKWIDEYLKFNLLILDGWNLLKEFVKIVISPFWILSGYFVSVIMWSEKRATQLYGCIPNKIKPRLSWYVLWYFIGTVTLLIGCCVVYAKIKRRFWGKAEEDGEEEEKKKIE
jgi:hypothetical protein